MNKILFLFITIMISGCYIATPSKGEKTGHIIKIATSGLMCKSIECQLIRGGFNDGSGVMGNEFDFFVEDKDLLFKLEKAMKENIEVTVFYEVEFITSGTRCEVYPPSKVYAVEFKKKI